MFKKINLIILILVVVFSCLVLFRSQHIPIVSGYTLSGNSLKLEDIYKNKPTLIMFWSTTCSSCIEKMPDVVNLYNKLHLSNLEIIGISMCFDSELQVRALVEKLQIPFNIILDKDSTIAQAFNVEVTPTFFLISKNGYIKNKSVGYLNIDKIYELIKLS